MLSVRLDLDTDPGHGSTFIGPVNLSNPTYSESWAGIAYWSVLIAIAAELGSRTSAIDAYEQEAFGLFALVSREKLAN